VIKLASKKKQVQQIKEDTWTRWCTISNFFEDMTGQKVFSKQEKFFEDVEDIKHQMDIILCCGRGCGKTWSLAVVALWFAFVLAHVENQPIDVAVLAGSKDESRILFKYLRKILKGHDEIDQYIAENQRGGLRFTRDYIEFKDGSSIEALPCSLTGVCGPRANLLIIDEAGLKDFNEEVKDEAFEIITGKPYGRIIMASTPYYFKSPFVQTWNFAEKKGWRRHHWSQYDCSWINKEKIEAKKSNLSEIQFKIRVLGEPTELQGRMFEPGKLRKVLMDYKEIRYADYAAVIAGLDWGQNIAETALVIVQINPVDNKVRVKYYRVWDNPDHSEIIPSILQTCENHGVQKIKVDSNPPNACAMLKKDSKFTRILVDEISFTSGHGDAMYDNLARLIEKELIEIPHDYTGSMNTLTEQLREMKWEKDPKKRTDLVDALALACSEESNFLRFKKLQVSASVNEELKAWREEMEKGKSINILPEMPSEEEEQIYPEELRGNSDDQILYPDPTLGFSRMMTKKEARGIWKNQRAGMRLKSIERLGRR